MVLSLVAGIVPMLAYGDELDETLADLKNQQLSAETRRNSAQSRVDALNVEKDAVVEQKMALEERNSAANDEIKLINQQISLINEQIDSYDAQIAAKEQDVANALNRENEQFERFKTRIRAMEESGGYNVLALILNADSFGSILSAMDDYGDVMDADKEIFKDLQAARYEHEQLQAELELLRADCEEKKLGLKNEQSVLEQEREALNVSILEAEQQLIELADQIKEAEAEQAAAEAALADAASAVTSFLAEYNAARAAERAASIQGSAISPASGSSDSSGDSGSSGYDYSVSGSGSWCWPFPSSYRISSTMKPRWGSYHSGVDIDGFNLEGASIVAADGGTVIKASWYGGYGNCVIIDHNNGYQTLYGHLCSIYVAEGSAVSPGQSIGGVGSTGSATGTHLHFEILSGGGRVNPLAYYSGWELEAGAGDPS